MFARVIVDIHASPVDRFFDYAVGENLTETAVPGMRVAVPFGRMPNVEGYIISLSDETEVPPDKIRSIRKCLDDIPALLPSMIDLAFWIRDTYHCLLVDALRLMLPASMRGGRVAARMIPWLFLTDADPSDAESALKKTPALLRALTVLREHEGAMPLSELRKLQPLSADQLARLTRAGFAEERFLTLNRRPYSRLTRETFVPDHLTGEQADCVTAVCDAIDRGFGSFLLQGVTGSGKTEVYLTCAQHALDMGKGVIILVPEIALTPQMVSRFTGRFGENAAVLHSRLSDGERFDEWQRIRRGEARVVIGARSAIFAPMSDPGFIVVDEEHETSYRSDHTPRYDAVEAACRRASAEGAVLLAGSATPSVARFHQARSGRFTLLSMPHRVANRPLPPVEIVDMREELLHGNRTVLSGSLVKALDQCVRAGKQAILFLNRRGYASFVSCRACGEAIRCPDCDLSMTYHKTGNRLMCHYCGREMPAPTVCPACGSRAIRQFGGGTEKIQEEVLRRFPNVSVLRMDADTTRGKEGHLPILEAFGRGEAQILVGTQMVAKGLDFPNVTLVGVVAADIALFGSDYRSEERTFDLVTQVAGRAGRSVDGGRVIVQTYAPEHDAIVMASHHDYAAFYEREIEARRLSQLPPFARFFRILISNESETVTENIFQCVSKELDARLKEAPEAQKAVLHRKDGPCPVEKIKGITRKQILIKALPEPESFALESLLDTLVRDMRSQWHPCTFEVDPISLL